MTPQAMQQLKQQHHAAVAQLGYLCGRMEHLGGYKYHGSYKFIATEEPQLQTIFHDALIRGYEEQCELSKGET